MQHEIQRQEAPHKATRRDWIGLAVIAIPCLIYSMDLTVLHLAVPQITADLKPQRRGLLWIVDIYGFMVAGALVTMGTLGDRVGRRKVLLIGAAAFGVTSVLAASSTSAEMLIFARALQGLAGGGAGAIDALAHPQHVPRPRRARVRHRRFGSLASPPAPPSVRLVGGLILEHFWWGAVFLINVPIMLTLLILGPLLLPEFRDPNAGRMDILSAAQSVVAVLAVIFGIKRIAEDGLALLAVCVDCRRPHRRRRVLPPRAPARRSADRRAAVRDAGVQRRAGDERPWAVHGAGLVPVHHPVPATGARHGSARGRHRGRRPPVSCSRSARWRRRFWCAISPRRQ